MSVALAAPLGGGVWAVSPDGTAAQPGIGFGADPTTGIYRLSDGTIGFSIKGLKAIEMLPVANAVDYVGLRGSATGGTQPCVSVLAQGSDANVGLALVPLGTGGLSAARPDGTAAGGVARGLNSVDWQQSRTISSMAATAGGSVIGGGVNNTASGTNSVVAGGSTNSVSIGAGWVPGGVQAIPRGINAGAWSSGRFNSANGSAQHLEHVLRAATSDATPTRLCGDVSTGVVTGVNSVPLVDDSSLASRIQVVARNQAGTDSAMWSLDVLVGRATGLASVVVTGGSAALAPTQSTGTGSTWRLAVAADTTFGGPAISGTGALATSIRWVAIVTSTEVGAG